MLLYTPCWLFPALQMLCCIVRLVMGSLYRSPSDAIRMLHTDRGLPPVFGEFWRRNHAGIVPRMVPILANLLPFCRIHDSQLGWGLAVNFIAAIPID
jgi:hypothetical protein